MDVISLFILYMFYTKSEMALFSYGNLKYLT